MSRYAVLNQPDAQALQWYVENGVNECLGEEPQDRTAATSKPAPIQPTATQQQPAVAKTSQPTNISPLPSAENNQPDIMGTAEAIVTAQKLADTANSLDELKEAITKFDGLSIKKTATNIIFADGRVDADIMVIGEAPGAEDDIQGKPFVGESGQLFDKIFSSIDLSREAENIKNSIYISNILNWRPPGNRTPTQGEIDIARPFIEKHISLAKPKIIVTCGAVAAKGLLQQNISISKLRGKFHEYQTPQNHTALVMATYHPAYLLRTPSQKRATWNDMLMLKEKLSTL